MQIKKEISLILIFIMTAALLAGCSDITTITINEDCSGSYTEVCTMSKAMWDMSLGTSYTDDDAVIAAYQSFYPDADITIEDNIINDTASKEIHLNMDFKNESDFQQLMNAFGTASVQFNTKYFSKSPLYVPMQGGQADRSDLISDIFDTLEDEEALSADVLRKELENMNIKQTITFPYTVSQTNGQIQEDGKTVVWSVQQLDNDMQRLYAAFGAQDSAKSPTFTGAKNGKYYNTSVTLHVNSENLLDQVNVNGQIIHSDYLSLAENGTYKITALDMNGNKRTIKFCIDMTKPVVKGVKNGNTYKKTRTIKFSDKGSGIKNASLNGKNINSGKKVSKKGSYKLLVTDKAGNKKMVKFKIK